MSEPLTREEREDINRRATIPQLSIHKQEVRRLLADLERAERERDEMYAACADAGWHVDGGDPQGFVSRLKRERDEANAWRDRVLLEAGGIQGEDLDRCQRANACFAGLMRERDGARAVIERIVKLAQVPDVPEAIPQPILLLAISEILAIAKGER